MLLTGYSDFSLTPCTPCFRTEPPTEAIWAAHFRLHTDVVELFPYINGLARSAALYDKPLFIRFVLDEVLCGLHPHRGSAAPFADRQEALRFVDRLIGFLNDVSQRREVLEPNFKRWHPVPILEIYRILPQTNCSVCGFQTCLAFAAAVSKQKASPYACPSLRRPLAEQAVYPVMDQQGQLISTVTLELDPLRVHRHRHGGRKDPLCARGQIQVPTSTTRSSGDPPEGLTESLTGRELEVLRLLSQGATNGEISQVLAISPHTVKSHVIHIFNKLGVNDRTQAAVWAARHHLV